MDAAPPIDAVITWVDGSDPAHRQRLQAYLRECGHAETGGAAPTRFGDCNEIEYCVASLLRHAPWLRTIHIVTDQQAPAFIARLRGTALESRVRVVDHREFFGGYESFLPTFSNRAIECLMWRIPGLAERFVYCNDDFVLLRAVAPTDFFQPEGGLVLRGRWRGDGRVFRRARAGAGLALIERKLATADADAAIAFACVQSLDLATAPVRERVLGWLAQRVGRLPGAATESMLQ